MKITLELDPDSVNNNAIVTTLWIAMATIPDLHVDITGDIYAWGTWHYFGDPAAPPDSDYAGSMNATNFGYGPLGTGQYRWLVNDHRVT